MNSVDSPKIIVSISQSSAILLDITLANCEAVPQPRPRLGANGVYSTPANSKINVFKADLTVRARSYRGRQKLVNCPVELTCLFVFSGLKNEKWEWETRQSKGDFDNLEKGVADALTGIVWTNDSCVVKNTTHKLRAPIGVKPFVRVIVTELPPAFDVIG